ncbi:hypothetical protein DYD21_08085 [Rhodohalobacter sp. SW132]|uniref:DUF6544 family protein n=1 Tax=Rhodohalobacter sp. SW132 TaxID=2293433 RepID=UPI000E222D3E|nr:DUF6544 family protein [Rhodohalobacter sp. SW132]REL37731.1 hypothetical protein DYD21_08085 [Rhodohalobacter sp. SW132]
MMKKVIFYTIFAIGFLAACTSPAEIFENEVAQFMSAEALENEFISEDKLAELPEPVQHYFYYSGFLNQPLSGITEILWADTKIKLGPDQAWRDLETRQYNFTESGSRLAYMNARMAGVIPFEGRDKYHNGQGHMLGTLGRLIKVFDNHSREVTLGGAVILLAEALLEPSIALQEYITWEPIDEHTAGATLHHGDITVSGIFRFNEAGEFIRFESSDRPYEISSGVYEPKPFSIDLEEYHEADGLKIAGRVYATWHLEDGDFIYWDGKITGLRRNVKL